MGQTQDNFCLNLKEVAIWAGIELLGYNSYWVIRKSDENLKLGGKDYVSALHYGKNVFSAGVQLSKTSAEETSLLFKFMAKVSKHDHFSKPQLATDKENYNFVINPINGSCELSTNSLMIRMDDHGALIICGKGVERFSDTKKLLRAENVLMFVNNKESRERTMNRRQVFQEALASKNGRMEVMKLYLDWPVVIMLSFVIGLACCDAKYVEMEASPATNALLSLHSCIQDMAARVLTFPVFHFGNCYLILEGVCSFIPTSMESIEVLYVTTRSLRNDLEASFSYSPKLVNEIMISCRKRIATLNNQNRKSEVTTSMSTLQFENCTMKGIVNDGVSMFMGIAEETMFDILDVANEFVLVSIFNVFDICSDVLMTVLVEMHVKQGHIYCAHQVVIWKALIGRYGKKGECEYAFEIISLYSLVLTRQWDPGKFNVCCCG
ncbi:protein SHORTAGE IN CHIASMATA [Trifolium repens]|nr:protein SHORTAGE IN CHIASMATA [Trifolium repens]